MPWRDEIGAQVPPPREPDLASLRRDILDELADHLGCAMDRELRKTDDEGAARSAVLKRFGDPAAVARRLYLEAIGGRIMMQRIALATNIIVAAVCVTLVAFTWSALRQNRDLQEAMLARLEALAEQSTNVPLSADWTELVLEMRDESASGPRLPGWSVELHGRPYSATETLKLQGTTDAEGIVRWPRIRPGSYVLAVSDPHGIRLNKGLVAPPGETQHHTIVWPRMEEQEVEISCAPFAEAWSNLVERYITNRMAGNREVPPVAFLEAQLRGRWSGPGEMTWWQPDVRLLLSPDGGIALLPHGPVEAGRVEVAERLRVPRRSAVGAMAEYALEVHHVYTRRPSDGSLDESDVGVTLTDFRFAPANNGPIRIEISDDTVVQVARNAWQIARIPSRSRGD